jgi:hypothetical protein
MNLEDRIRTAMLAHEHEAPTAAEFQPGRSLPRRRTHWLPAVAAAVVVLAVVGTVVAIRGVGDGRHSAAPAPTALDCPPNFAAAPGDFSPLWVPAKARGVDGTRRLVPLQTPSRALVCGYESQRFSATRAGMPLTGTAALGRDLSRLPGALAWLPRTLPGQSVACLSDARAIDSHSYLIGLTYPGGTMWVSAPGNHCDGATNGSFVTSTNLATFAAAALTAHEVPPLASTPTGPHTACEVTNSGRLGQETEMVPDHPVSATMCKVTPVHPASSPILAVPDPGTLAAKLNSLHTAPSASGCNDTGPNGAVYARYELLFRYSDGPPVLVILTPGCHPSVDNRSLQADDGGAVIKLMANQPTHK